jgi:hypothetical protein
MSVYQFTKKSGILQNNLELPATYHFDVDEDGAELVEAIVGGLDFFYIVPEEEREALQVECLERMAADRMDAAIYQAESREAA